MASISDEVREELEALRSRESADSSMAVVLKIDPESMSVVSDETYEDITLDELAEELPEHQPRYIVYTMGYDTPCFIFLSPQGTKPELQVGTVTQPGSESLDYKFVVQRSA